MSDLTEIERQCRMLMTAHGVGRLDFEWGRGKTRIAACHLLYYPQRGYSIPVKIVFSRHFAERLSMEQIRTVMLHEIAHALTPGERHGPVWRAKAIELGISPDRCMNSGVSVEKAWTSHCTNCNKKVSAQHRAPLRVWLCATAACKPLLPFDRALRWMKNGDWVEIDDMPVRFISEYNQMKREAAMTKSLTSPD